MTYAELYLRAAEDIASGREEFSCTAICSPGSHNLPARVEYTELFKPENADFAWGGEWGSSNTEDCYAAEFDTIRDCRILALCFMAAISEADNG